MVSAANVLVYAGDGAKPEFVNDTISTFQRLLSEACHVKRVYASELKHCGWLHTTDMLIIPGGRATPYATDLKGRANTNIINYAKRGGVYIGLGAGAYYASQRTEFEKGNPNMEIIRDLPLGFYPGVCRGAVFPGFKYNSTEGAIAADIDAQGSYSVYYHGGGAFIDPDQYANTQVLARYAKVKDSSSNAAVVLAKVGKGYALLSGVHVEYISTMKIPTLYHTIHPLQSKIDKLVQGWLQELNMAIRVETTPSQNN
ncbi:biotin holocarboxylase synthetase [Entomophthora muscae]|uniref:Biotin holocarboxylase synthetase n=1 Tax=Entomophthora muscae TaxID=34485 RepID=A0ACC2UA22_9FUNG|nr:biotin holocarboxylase synthetase [Entomophthora muscae]